MLDYADIRLLAAVAAAGTPRKAAVHLLAHAATVYRRLKSIEQQLGAKLFERIEGRYVPTAITAEVLEQASAIEQSLAELNRRLTGHDQRLSGTVTVTTTDTLAALVSAALPAFRESHPDVNVVLLTSNAFADMARHEADVAVRPTRTPPETLIGRRVATFAYNVYASTRLHGPARKTARVPDGPWIGFDASLAAIPAGRWLDARVESDRFVVRVNSLVTAAEAASSGLGFAILPDYLGVRPALGLTRVSGPVAELASEVWVLTHVDLRYTPRVRALAQTLGDRLRSLLG